jgi:hypothetical protein
MIARRRQARNEAATADLLAEQIVGGPSVRQKAGRLSRKSKRRGWQPVSISRVLQRLSDF